MCKGQRNEVLRVITQRELKEKEAFLEGEQNVPQFGKNLQMESEVKTKTFRDKLSDEFRREKNSLIFFLGRMVHVRDGVSATHSVYLHGVRCADSETLPLPCVVFLPSVAVWVYWRAGREFKL